MKNEMEKFINQHASEFDTEIPNSKIWDTIEKNLSETKKQKVFSIRDIYKYCSAAAVFFITITSMYFLCFKNPKIATEVGPDNAKINLVLPQQKIEDTFYNEKQISNENMIALTPEYASNIKQNFKTIQIKQEKLKSETKDNPKLYKRFVEDLKTLDSTYKMLEQQAEYSPNRDIIIQAMMQNLALKSELLARQLTIMNEFKNIKNQQNEKNNTRNM
jgi:hypothetical protein